MASLSPSQDAEILVHVTAPSRVADDAVYRQLAQAYLAFQPRSRSELPPLEDATCRPGQRLALAPSSSQGFAVPSSEQLLVINSQNLSFRSALDNLSSPRLQFAPLAQNHVVPSSQETGVGSQTSWCAPPSQISDSYPMPDAGMLHISPTRVLQRYLGRPSLRRPSPESSSRSPPSSPSPRKRPPPPLRGQGRIDVPSSLPEPETEQQSPPLPLRAPLYVKVNQTIPVTPQVPETNGPGPEALDSSELFAESAFDITHISSSVVSNPSPAPSHRAGSEPPPAKRPKVGHLQHGDLVRSSSDTGPAILSSNPATEELSYSLEIRPPSPPVGVTDVDPSDLISEKLAKLARDLSSRYRPDSKREIDPFERGYWLLDCKGWSPEVRFGAWVFLNNYLRSGLAGWGTWCRRDNRHSWIRLYCWGHVAKHTYLLLYLASGRHLKHTGAVWYGADGEPVLDVPPYDKQS
ncbi:hypothetical protein AK830_g7077 [Neonectria ditissima]|uniref:Uncharacterized protein n=1 Tax=Neonectria ditissima TaxID=78410 RepID=A0A0P7BG20_9HYPO|nr:hypothetical protein AK830_g7077 [Neonectria ditissima]